MRKLGKTQRAVLRALVEHQEWGRHSQWLWDTRGGTERILLSLRRRGLVSVTLDEYGSGTYRPTDEGRRIALDT